MSQYIHLIGSEDVSRAGHNMQSAAEQMSRAASSIHEANESQRRFMDDWLDRLDAIMNQKAPDQ